VVASAEEAVKTLREHLGENAQVISVRQVEGAGLARFLSAPKLEIIAQVGPSVPPPEEAPLTPPPVAPAPPRVAEKPETPAAENLIRILQRGGIAETLLGRLKSMDEWESITRRPLRDALIEVAVILRTEYQKNPKKPTGSCVAFIGTAGAGKTTALCKRLASEVFFKQRRAAVLKVDMDKANPGDGLAVFCDVLGVPMVRSLASLPSLGPDETLYIDFPGIASEKREEVADMVHHLATLPTTSRVLVVNAAYEIQLIKQAYRLGAALDATHVVFTHLDELTHWGKLWEFILGSELTPLFFSAGQNIAGDFTESIFDAVLERSFPPVGKEIAVQPVAL